VKGENYLAMSETRAWGDYHNGSTPRRKRRTEKELLEFSPTYHFTIGDGIGYPVPPDDAISWIQDAILPGCTIRWNSTFEHVLSNTCFKAGEDIRNKEVKLYRRNAVFNNKRRTIGVLIRKSGVLAVQLQNSSTFPVNLFDDVVTLPDAARLCYLIESLVDQILDLIYVDPKKGVFPACLPRVTKLDENGKVKCAICTVCCYKKEIKKSTYLIANRSCPHAYTWQDGIQLKWETQLCTSLTMLSSSRITFPREMWKMQK